MSDYVLPSLPSVATIFGFLLSGAMLGHGLAIPVILDTNTDPTQLVRQWSRNFHYGHLIMPPIAVATFAMHGIVAFQKQRAGLPDWMSYAAAGGLTVAIVPLTLIVMASTNKALFDLEKAGDNRDQKLGERNGGEARKLVARWGYLHTVRSIMPAAGALVALRELLHFH